LETNNRIFMQPQMLELRVTSIQGGAFLSYVSPLCHSWPVRCNSERSATRGH
jgi:hypothetical protein